MKADLGIRISRSSPAGMPHSRSSVLKGTSARCFLTYWGTRSTPCPTAAAWPYEPAKAPNGVPAALVSSLLLRITDAASVRRRALNYLKHSLQPRALAAPDLACGSAPRSWNAIRDASDCEAARIRPIAARLSPFSCPLLHCKTRVDVPSTPTRNQR